MDTPSPWETVHGQSREVSCAGQLCSSVFTGEVADVSGSPGLPHSELIGSMGKLRKMPSLFFQDSVQLILSEMDT